MKIRNPIRKVSKTTLGSKYITIPKEIELEPGDFVIFKEEGNKVIIEKIEVLKNEEGETHDSYHS